MQRHGTTHTIQANLAPQFFIFYLDAFLECGQRLDAMAAFGQGRGISGDCRRGGDALLADCPAALPPAITTERTTQTRN